MSIASQTILTKKHLKTCLATLRCNITGHNMSVVQVNYTYIKMESQ